MEIITLFLYNFYLITLFSYVSLSNTCVCVYVCDVVCVVHRPYNLHIPKCILALTSLTPWLFWVPVTPYTFGIEKKFV